MKGREQAVLLLLSTLISLNFVLFCFVFFSLLADHERHDDLIAFFFDQNYVSLETTLGQHNFI